MKCGTGGMCSPPALGLPVRGRRMEKRQCTTAGTPCIGSNSQQTFVEHINFKNVLEKGLLAPAAHKVNRFSVLLLRPWSQPYGLGRLLSRS